MPELVTRRQFHVLYRDFLFSVVDRELLSRRGTGDASRLLLQIVALLAGLSVCLCTLAFVVGTQPLGIVRLLVAWSVQHFVISTTMLVVGVLAVLSWDRLFPTQRDVLVLGPLPIRAHTILLGRMCAAATALAVAVVSLHAAAGVILPLAMTRTVNSRGLDAPVFTSDRAIPPVTGGALKDVLDRDLAALLDDGPLAPGAGGGVAIGASVRGERHLLAYGAARPDSIFQIASVTKPFTGVLLAEMAERGLVRLDEPVRLLIPDAGVPQPPGPEITLVDLATHRSGLPGMPPGFRWSERPNPVADFDASTLYAYVRARGLHRRVSPPFVYSNVGYGLLGYALSQRAGVGYPELVRRTIAEPLGMSDTAVDLLLEQKTRLIQGHSDAMEPIAAWEYDVLAGGGGLSSTVGDLLTFLDAHLHPERLGAGPLSAALVTAQRARSPIAAGLDIGLGWVREQDSGIVVHTGAILGFTSVVFFRPETDTAVVVLSNVGPGTAWSADAIAGHVRARLDGQPAPSLAAVAVPATGGVRGALRMLFAYWVTMTGASLFVFGLAASVQGLAAVVLPRRQFVGASSWLQIGMFCAILLTYVLQPMAVRPGALLAAQGTGILAWSPSYWFLGLFQQLSGSPALAPLASKAWFGLGIVLLTAGAAYSVSYVRTLRQIAEQPDSMAGISTWSWFPSGGAPARAALMLFAVKTALRSAQHRVILAFYWGIGFALIIFVLKIPRGQQLDEGPIVSAWDEAGVPLLLSSIVTMAFAVLAARLAFSMPRELQANWIFRVLPRRGAAEYLSARRRALYLLSVVPVWFAWAAAFVMLWPWQPALGHLLLLACLGLVFVELALLGPLKIPCTCSYLPGKSQLHLVFVVAVLLFVGIVRQAVRLEIEALQDPVRFAAMIGSGAAAVVALRLVVAATCGAEPVFEESDRGEAVTLGLWDGRVLEASGRRRRPPPRRAVHHTTAQDREH